MGDSMNCNDCAKRSKCKKLCPEAEAYASQDHVNLREKTMELVNFNENYLDLISNIYLTNKEKQILTLFGYGLSRQDVCQLLNISKGNLRVRIKILKDKFNDSI